MNGILFSTKKCHLCGKEFCRSYWEEYHYKQNGYFFCGWNCYRKWYNEHRVDDLEKEEKDRNVAEEYADEVGMSEAWVRKMFRTYGEVSLDELKVLKENRNKRGRPGKKKVVENGI